MTCRSKIAGTDSDRSLPSNSHLDGGSVSDEGIINRNRILGSSHTLNQVTSSKEAYNALDLGGKIGVMINGNRDTIIEKLIEMDDEDKLRWENNNTGS